MDTLHMELRAQPANLTVLTRHHQPPPLSNAAIYAPNSSDTSDLMIRLRESIKQKEEFLKSPLPHGHQQPQQQQHQQQQQQQQHFFPHTPPSGSPQLSIVSTSSTSAGSSGLSATTTARGQVRTLVKQPLSVTSSASSMRELLPASCDMHNFYARNLPGNFAIVDAGGLGRSGNSGGSGNGSGSSGAPLYGDIVKSNAYTAVARSQRQGNGNANSVGLRDKYAKDLDYLESLQETGVTNKVFERKLVSHMAKGFDPFKPLSINTSNVIEATGASGNVVLVKKPGVLYDSLQHHPLHQLQIQQLQQTQHPKMHHATNTAGASTVDGQQCSRMEIHKASLANATIDQTPSKYSSKLPEADEKPTVLTNIAESGEMPSIKAVSDCNVLRRFKPAASFDEANKPMRRISYLRATNNENEFANDGTSTGSANTNAAAATITESASSAMSAPVQEQAERDTDPTYDVVAGECELLEDSPSSGEELRSAAATAAATATATATTAAVGHSGGSRRASVNSEMRNSIHIDNIIADLNGKLDTKDMPNELEAFETEMEIKSSCINGKRLSEYRSWRQVKIEIKGDMLKIYPSRGSKSDNNVIELDIRNFQIFDESVDKKKYIFRMQSKPTTTGIELNLEDTPDKLTSSGSSTSASVPQSELQQQSPPHTEILFKTKSITEMKRIFGLLQWKNSLIYDDNDLHGKQLAEPQKTAATASVPTATDCDDNVQQATQQQQQQHQPAQHLQPDYSPISSTSRELEVSDSISPVMKTRKSSSHKNIPDKDLGSPKAKNWKDLLFRRGGGSHNADLSPSNLSSTAKTTGSIGVPLKTCPMSKNNEYVPHIVDVCTNIVETKGLGVVGIYRIPGNKAAISELSEQVNKTDFSWDRCHTDVRWEDVNVVSSLLKLFIRSLPDALLPTSFYNNFIEADKKPGLLRLKELKDLLESLPRYSYETMKHLIRHLNRVSKNCDVNLMEPKNLAIIFGPSIIRTPNDTLEIAVKDMKHQCRIVELLVTQYEYFFEHGTTPDLADVSGNVPIVPATDASSTAAAQSQEQQTNMLLHNVSKIERLTERETTRTSRFIPQLRRRTHSKRSAVSSDTYSGESVLSLDYSKTTHTASSSSSTNVTTASSSSSSSTNVTTATSTTKKKERGFLTHSARTHHRKASLDEKDSGSGSGGSLNKEQQRSSVDISILLTDDESSNSRISDSGSMSLNAITDTLDSKLRNLRSGSESNDENGSPDFPKNRRHTFGQPLHLHSENIPYADESPERYFHNSPLDAPNALMLSRSCTVGNTNAATKSINQSSIDHDKEKDTHLKVSTPTMLTYKSNKLHHSATVPINVCTATGTGGIASPPTAASTPTALVTVKTTNAGGGGLGVGLGVGVGSAAGMAARNSYASKNLRFSSSVYEQCCSDDDSEGSTTSDPKEALILASPSFFLERYNKKRRDHRLFRSASFNCRNYTTRHGNSGAPPSSALTKDEKTDMNLTKKRQIQNKQNRSIKRRHTVGGPHDYASTGANCNHQCKSAVGGAGGVGGVGGVGVGVGVGAGGGSGVGGGGGGGTTTTTTVLRRIPIPSANGNISINNNNNNNSPQHDSNNGNNGSSATVAVAGAGEHVLEVGIRIKNINRSRY